MFLQQRRSFQEHLNSRLYVKKEAYKYMLSSGQGSGCRMHNAGGQGRYHNQLGRPLHEAIDGFEKGIFIGQVYILMGVGFYPTSRFPTSSHHGSCWIGAGRQVKVSRLVQHSISLRGLKEI